MFDLLAFILDALLGPIAAAIVGGFLGYYFLAGSAPMKRWKKWVIVTLLLVWIGRVNHHLLTADQDRLKPKAPIAAEDPAK